MAYWHQAHARDSQRHVAARSREQDEVILFGSICELLCMPIYTIATRAHAVRLHPVVEEPQSAAAKTMNKCKSNYKIHNPAQPGVVADGSRLQEGYRSMGRSEGKFQGARKRARG
jgi:hypothetical protein